MSYSISTNKDVSIERYGNAFREMGKSAESTESVAGKVVDFLNENINGKEAEAPLALVRFFRTIAYNELTFRLQESVRQRYPEIKDNTNCLTLLATRGILEQWNRPEKSLDHHCIPLFSSEMVEKAPMIAKLISELGIEVNRVVAPFPITFLHPREKIYKSFYIPEAAGNEVFPAQAQFIEKYKIRSVIGFGSLLPTGDMFAVMMFFRVMVPSAAALAFAELAGSIEGALNDVRSGRKASCNILIADEAEGAKRIKRVLPTEHKLLFAGNLNEAMDLWKTNDIDLVICGTHFDESRMFVLLDALRRDKEARPKPFICFQEKSFDVLKENSAILSSTARMLGARCFLNGTQMSDDDLCFAIESYLPENIWQTRQK